MSLTGKIMNFFADNAMTIPAFPRTKVKAVSNDDGVGLDALLDGINTSLDGKADSSHTHNYLPLSGGTVTGTLTLNGNTVLNSNSYGTSLPSVATAGKVFFKKVSS